ncbi:MAG TPA: hypothetical protein VHE10_00400 [Candidatus Paceibacterota bacterium]|nr:hypothetical protein [Candidatus Paceibacterota bacterium]
MIRCKVYRTGSKKPTEIRLPDSSRQAPFLAEVKRQLRLRGEHALADPDNFGDAGYDRITDMKGRTLFPLEEHRKSKVCHRHGEGRRHVPQHIVSRHGFNRARDHAGFRPIAVMTCAAGA